MITEWNQHVIECFPNEACGVIVNGEVRIFPNVHPDPLNHFEIDNLHWFECLRDDPNAIVIHSHTHGTALYDPRTPSYRDMELWLRTGNTIGICFTDGSKVSEMLWMHHRNTKPLEGREFIHGYQDCYSIIRDYYQQTLDIDLMNIARSFEWWENNQNLYLENYERAGFIQVPLNDLKTHDVLLFKVRAKVPNHAGVVIGTNRFIHQPAFKLSGTDSIQRWSPHITHVLRHRTQA